MSFSYHDAWSPAPFGAYNRCAGCELSLVGRTVYMVNGSSYCAESCEAGSWALRAATAKMADEGRVKRTPSISCLMEENPRSNKRAETSDTSESSLADTDRFDFEEHVMTAPEPMQIDDESLCGSMNTMSVSPDSGSGQSYTRYAAQLAAGVASRIPGLR